MQNLFTNHDKYHIHKSFGFICLFHYFIRLYFLIMYGTMFFKYDDYMTYVTPLFHLLLSLSSFIFHVPINRFDSKIIIWKELQLHNIVFISRSSTIMIYLLIFSQNKKNKISYVGCIIIKLFIIQIHHYIADKITKIYSIKNKTTTRDINFDNIPIILKKYYSVCQLFAINALLLCESDKSGRGLFESAFIIMFPIQLSAFLMTLVRKSIISNNMWHILYGISLMTPYLIPINNKSDNNFKLSLSILYVVLRLYININKYILMNLIVFLYIQTII